MLIESKHAAGVLVKKVGLLIFGFNRRGSYERDLNEKRLRKNTSHHFFIFIPTNLTL